MKRCLQIPHKAILALVLACVMSATSVLPVFGSEVIQNAQAPTSEGTLFAWGLGSYGQLGNGIRNDQTRPVPIALTQEMREAGVNSWSDVVLSHKTNHHLHAVTTFALTPTGELFAWGNGANGERGNGTKNLFVSNDPSSIRPAPVALTQEMREAGAETWNDVTLTHGRGVTFALTPTGKLFAWGSGANGLIGNGGTEDQTRPVAIELTQEMIDAGIHTWNDVVINPNGRTITVLAPNGELFVWGQMLGTYLGCGRTSFFDVDARQLTPVSLPLHPELADAGLDSWNDVTIYRGSTGSVTFALTSAGDLFVWGRLSYSGQPSYESNRSTPLKIELTDEMRAAGVNSWHNVAVSQEAVLLTARTAAGDIFVWGTANAGQLGDGSFGSKVMHSPVPFEIPQELRNAGVNSWNDVTLTSSIGTFFARTTSGELFSWGWGGEGQLGNGTVGVIPGRFQPTPASVSLTQEMRDAGADSWNDVTLGHFADSTFALVTPSEPPPKLPKGTLNKILQAPEGTTIPSDISFDFEFTRVQQVLSTDPLLNSRPIAEVPMVGTNGIVNMPLDMTTLATASGTTSVEGKIDLMDLLADLVFPGGGVYVWELREVPESSGTSSPSYLSYDAARFQIRAHADKDGTLFSVEVFKLISGEGDTFTLGNKIDSANFINTFRTILTPSDSGALEVTKHVTGAYANLDTLFNFTINLTGHALAPLPAVVNAIVVDSAGTQIPEARGTVTIAYGAGSFQMAHGETLRILSLPAGTTATVTETAALEYSAGYRALSGGTVSSSRTNTSADTALSTSPILIADTGRNAADFTNAHQWTPPMGLVLTYTPWTFVLFATLLLMLLVVSRRRKLIEQLPITH